MTGKLVGAVLVGWFVGKGKSSWSSLVADPCDSQTARHATAVGNTTRLKALWIAVLSVMGLLALDANATPLAIHFSGNQWTEPAMFGGSTNFLNINLGSAVEGSFIFDTEGLPDYYPADPEQLLKEGVAKRFSFQTIDHSAPFGSFLPYCGCSGLGLHVAGRSISIAASDMYMDADGIVITDVLTLTMHLKTGVIMDDAFNISMLKHEDVDGFGDGNLFDSRWYFHRAWDVLSGEPRTVWYEGYLTSISVAEPSVLYLVLLSLMLAVVAQMRGVRSRACC